MAARDLCTRADVLAYAPGYTADATTDALIDRLIISESRAIHARTGREFKAIDPAVTTRRFDIGRANSRARVVEIGDLSAAPSSVKIIDPDQATTVETLTSPSWVALPRVREEWEPITSLFFPTTAATSATLIPGYVLEVTGTWGFPSVPADVKEACAQRILFRYVSDVAAAGTRFAEALAEVNVGALFASSEDVIRSYQAGLVG